MAISKQRTDAAGLASPARRALLSTMVTAARPANSVRQPGDVLVLIFMRGGMDALTLCPPVADGDYYNLRPTLAVPPIGAPGGALSITDPLFGLSPTASALLPAYQAGDLAIVHTAGSTDPTRSHFDAMRYMEAGLPGQTLPAPHLVTGWLARHLLDTPRPDVRPRSIFLDPILPTSMAGFNGSLPIPRPEEFGFRGQASTQTDRRNALGSLYANAPGGLAGAATSTLVAIDRLSAIDFVGYQPANGAVYPSGPFGTKLKNAAALIKAGVGAEVIEADSGSWDFHAEMGPLNGQLATFLQSLCDSLGAFYQDMGQGMSRVNVVAMSEFGRRVAENGSAGTDHGHGGAMLLMGKNVQGGRVMHDWQGLTPLDLDDGSLQVRIDYRDVLSELLSKRMGNSNLARVFPGHAFQDLDLFRG